MYPDDAMRVQSNAQAYVTRRGWRNEDAEDITAEMVVRALGAPEGHLVALRYLYLQALDALDPRNKHMGAKARQSSRTVHGIPFVQRQDTSLDELFHDVPASGRERAMLLLYAVYGFDMSEIGWMFGLTGGSISKILRAMRDTVAGVPKETRSHHAAPR